MKEPATAAATVIQLSILELSNVSCEGMRSLRIFSGAVPDFLLAAAADTANSSSSSQLRNLLGTFCDPILSGDADPNVVIESGASGGGGGGGGGQLAVFLDAPSATFKERERRWRWRRHHTAWLPYLLTCIPDFVMVIHATCWSNRI